MKNIDETIGKYFDEWKEHIEKIPKLERVLDEKKNELFDFQQEQNDTVNYKELYGYDNDKTRKAHYKKVLKTQYEEIDNLEKEIDFCKRRISFIKHRIQYLLSLKGEIDG